MAMDNTPYTYPAFDFNEQIEKHVKTLKINLLIGIDNALLDSINESTIFSNISKS